MSTPDFAPDAVLRSMRARDRVDFLGSADPDTTTQRLYRFERINP